MRLFLIILLLSLSFSASSVSKSRVESMIKEMVAERRSQLPMSVDKRTDWVSIAFIDGELHHTYQFRGVKDSVARDKKVLKKVQDALVLEKRNIYCTHPEMKLFREYNIPVVYNYMSDSGIFIARAYASAND